MKGHPHNEGYAGGGTGGHPQQVVGAAIHVEWEGEAGEGGADDIGRGEGLAAVVASAHHYLGDPEGVKGEGDEACSPLELVRQQDPPNRAP